MTTSPSNDRYYITDKDGWRMVDGLGRHFLELSIEDAQRTIEYYVNMGHGREYHIYRNDPEPELVCICDYDADLDEIVAHGPDIAV